MTASISAAIRGTNDHLAIGIGGTRQAVLSAAALRCLGGELQAQLWPTHARRDRAGPRARIDDIERVFTTEDLAPGEVIVAATGVSNGDLLRGVRFLADSARTHSLVMCTRCNWVRFVDGDPLLRARAARGSPAARLLASTRPTMPTQGRGRSRRCARSRIPSSGWTSSSSGSLYDVEVEGPKVKVIHSLTSMGCPAGPMIQEDISDAPRRRCPASRTSRSS